MKIKFLYHDNIIDILLIGWREIFTLDLILCRFKKNIVSVINFFIFIYNILFYNYRNMWKYSTLRTCLENLIK